MGSIGKGGVGGGGPEFFDPPSRNLLGHSYGILNISSESSAQAQSIGNLFEQIGLRGGGSVDSSIGQREAHTLRCRPRGESSQ